MEGRLSIVNWHSRYETGIPEIDAQHRRLFQAVNDLCDSFREGRAHAQVVETLAFLQQHSIEHFATEEAWMESHNFTHLAAHQLEHKEFAAHILDLKRRFEEGELLSHKVAIFLANWLQYHLDGGDLKFAQHARESDFHRRSNPFVHLKPEVCHGS